MRWVAIVTLLATGSFLWFLAQAFTDIYEEVLASGVEQSVRLSQFVNERDLPVALQDPIELFFVGDIMFSRAVGSTTMRVGDFSFPFLKSANVLKSADITFGNLESPISDKGKNRGSIYSFRADPRMIEGLQLAGFDVLSLANNHIWDYGAEALLDTVARLNKEGIKTIGVGPDSAGATAPARFRVKGVDVVFLGYTNLYPESLWATSGSPGVSPFQEEEIIDLIRKEKAESDLVIVSMHWGEEYQPTSNLSQQLLARRMVEAGADLIIGHHPHVEQEWEKYRGGWIFYSLGNFVFDQTQSEETMRGLALRVQVVAGRVAIIERVPVQISPSLQPELGNPQKL